MKEKNQKKTYSLKSIIIFGIILFNDLRNHSDLCSHVLGFLFGILMSSEISVKMRKYFIIFGVMVLTGCYLLTVFFPLRISSDEA